MRSLDWVLIQHDRFPFKKEMFGHRYAQGVFHVKMKAVIRVMFPQAKERQRLAANHRKQEKETEWIFPSQPSEGTNSANTSIFDFQPLELRHNTFQLFKPPNLLYIFEAALVN